ncbi:MAG: peroxiredoxin C [Candidatus Dasytiphilus stammeri]
MVLVSQKAPNFTSPAILGNDEIVENFNFYKYINNHPAVLFFWPMDFTFVCPSELIAFNKRYNQFKQRKIEVVGVSIDSVFVHKAWRNTSINNGGIGLVQYVMVSDIHRTIQKSYGIEHPLAGVALRSSFLIDKNGIVRHQIVNDFPLGRNIDEMIRLCDAMIYHEEHGEVCPAQWSVGKPGMIPSSEGVVNFLQSNYDKL